MTEIAPDSWRLTIRRRLALVIAAAGLWAVAIEARLVYLQVFAHEHYAARAERQHNRTVELAAKRGEILDRSERVLAYSVEAESIYAVPTEIGHPVQTVTALCRVLACDPALRASLTERLTVVPGKKRHFAWVRRQVSPEDARKVKELGLDGVGLLKEGRRFYPNTTLAAHVLGWVGLDNTGLGGIEAKYNDVIRGRPGTALVQVDARHRTFNRVEKPPTAGASVQLTIDQSLQFMVERVLREGVAEHRAKGGTAIVMDPWTGEILAMANEPTFNPNVPTRFRDDLRTNRAIQYIYEPGSTFKSVTAAAALEEGVMRTVDTVNVAPGHIRIGYRVVRDTHAYGLLSFEDVIVKSSNVGAIKVGFLLGPERLNRYVRRFGFGQRLSPHFDGESPGIVWSQLTDSALASVSMGYQIGVTPLQMATAASAIANGGQLMEPHLVKAVIGRGGRTLVQPKVLRQTITRDTAATLTTIMEGVVDRGTGKGARLDGFTVAGKTGTAAKLVNNVYSKSDYMSSFVGFFPSRRPAVTILVVVDAPQKGVYYGGAVAAPIFRRIADAASRHLALAPTVNPQPPVLISRPDPGPEVHVSAPDTMPNIVRTGGRPDLLPDLRGLSAREAVRVLARIGIHARVSGVGRVAEQSPDAGSAIDDVVECELRLKREPPPAAAVEETVEISRDDR